MGDSTAAGLLQLISAAVTPVVMISAAAALILGINQKHSALADRLRSLAAEFRQQGLPDLRAGAIRAQISLFYHRFRYAAAAHVLLYVSVVCFTLTVLLITLKSHVRLWDRAALAAFITGVGVMLAAVLIELLEIRLGGRTVQLEIDDVLHQNS